MVTYGCKRDRVEWGNSDYGCEEVTAMFRVMAGRSCKVNVSINNICISFPLWGQIITIG